MKERYFVNAAVDKAINDYLDVKKTHDNVVENSFMVVVIRLLVLIYGEIDIVNPRELKDSVALFNNLGKYGISYSDIAVFMEEILAFYNFQEENNKAGVKEQNPHFKKIMEYIVDMFVAKKDAVAISLEEEEKFLELAYTTHTKNPYRISFGYLMNDDAMYIERYYYSKLNKIDVTREYHLSDDITNNLEASAYKIDADNLEDKKMQWEVGKKLSTGNGYVDILLLMSVITTSISVIAILIFSNM